ncbi:MAG: hypothetical protein LJI21_02150 [Wolbachia endosymbiont of Menacanthus eurysternus]|nr:MAG: hypothetical protein LJI21_02150 [Wolbachia endosymbiont of Menacanthus eurysternus]
MTALVCELTSLLLIVITGKLIKKCWCNEGGIMGAENKWGVNKKRISRRLCFLVGCLILVNSSN